MKGFEVGFFLPGRNGELCLHVHGLLRRVAQRDARLQEVSLAGKRRDARKQHEILCRPHVGMSRTEEVRPARREGDDPVFREAVRKRDLQAGLALFIERHRRPPEEQRVEELARNLLAAAAALREGLEPEVALADHHHLRRRGEDLVGALAHHRFEELPAAVRPQGEEPPVHGGDSQLRPLRQLLPVALRTLKATSASWRTR